MVGNAVPVQFAEQLALKIRRDLKGFEKIDRKPVVIGQVVGPDFGVHMDGVGTLF